MLKLACDCPACKLRIDREFWAIADNIINTTTTTTGEHNMTTPIFSCATHKTELEIRPSPTPGGLATMICHLCKADKIATMFSNHK